MLTNTFTMDCKKELPSASKKQSYTISHPSRTIVHPKLEMTKPGDSDEMEADAVAEEVMEGKVCRQISGGGAGGGVAVSADMESRLHARQGGGQALPEGLRNMMERGFTRDFSQVRLHTDSEAADLSGNIGAKAFTHGNDIYFNRGQFAPHTTDGQRLVAHELTHVAQGGKQVARTPDGPTIGPDDAASRKKEDDDTTFAQLIVNLGLFKSVCENIKMLREANAPEYVGDVIDVIHKYNFDQKLAEAKEVAKLKEAGQGAARAVHVFGKAFDITAWALSTILDIKRAYDNRNDSIGGVYYIIRALATIAGFPYLPVPPIVKGLIAEFNTVSGLGDIYAEMDNAVIHPYRRAKEVGDFYGGPDSVGGLIGFGVASIPGLGEIGEGIGTAAGATYVAVGNAWDKFKSLWED